MDILNINTILRKLTSISECLRYHHAIVLTYKYSENVIDNANINIQIEYVTSKNINDALTYEPQVKVDTFKRFLSKGDCGFYAYLNGQFIHRSWVTFGPKKVTQWKQCAPLKLKQGEAYIHWCETVPWVRGMGVYPTVLNYIIRVLSGRVNEFYISTTADNIASRNGIRKAGFSLISGCEVTSFWGLKSEKPLGKEFLYEYQL